ncbi:hypothetical protein LCGC14_0894240 [marine sediment metagenome]|uniref:Uncharacterized protein n=1 Tax=marine sediment metagenome TaxID=412755 RepID=A0A0F9P329_9ZZZZ
MPYYHIKCGGRVSLFTRKCRKCKKKWPWAVYTMVRLPKDMVWSAKDLIKPRKGETKYARWADKIPGVSLVAGGLPNWPRWARIVTGLILLGVGFVLVRLLLNVFLGV